MLNYASFIHLYNNIILHILAKKSSIIKRIDKIFSMYIRLRDKGVCCTCGKICPVNYMDCGHYIDKSVCGLDLRWDEVNCNCQCRSCNRIEDGNKDKYKEFLINKYGKEILERFNQRDIAYNFDFEGKLEEVSNLLSQIQQTHSP